MIYFEYTPHAYVQLLKAYAEKFSTELINNRIIIPEAAGKGDIQYVKTFDGAEAIISDYILKELLLLRRLPSDKTNYILIINSNDKMRLNVSNNQNKSYAHENSPFALLGTSLIEYSAMIPAETYVRNIIISLPSHWVADLLSDGDENALLNKYLAFRLTHQQFLPLDEKLKTLLVEVLDMERSDPLFQIKINAAIPNVISQFFISLGKNIQEQQVMEKASLPPDDIERLQQVERMIIQSLDTDEGPEVDILAKKVAMSASTLQRKFKRLYNQGIYEYYYNYRLEEARRMLLVKEVPVQEVAYTLGFKDAAHFSRSYKKKFGFSPSQT
jgi:AraC-like DNA-binding protein